MIEKKANIINGSKNKISLTQKKMKKRIIVKVNYNWEPMSVPSINKRAMLKDFKKQLKELIIKFNEKEKREPTDPNNLREVQK